MDLIGIDIGGTKVSVCLGDDKGNLVKHQRVETSSLEGSKKGLPKLVELVKNVMHDGVEGIGLAVPGPVSTKKGMMLTPPNLPRWINVPIVRYFQEHFSCPIFMDNDANAGALAEWEFGKTKQGKLLVYLTMSTGMGGGIVLDGKIHQGETDTAGEVGHFVLDPYGPRCPCGQSGCWEVFCGGANIADRLKTLIKEGAQTKILEIAGSIDAVDMKNLAAAARVGDALALKIWGEFIERLAQGIGILLMTLNPDSIVLGTIAAHEKDLVMGPLQEALRRFTWDAPLKHCCIEPSQLGDDLGRLGALAVAMHGLKSY